LKISLGGLRASAHTREVEEEKGRGGGFISDTSKKSYKFERVERDGVRGRSGVRCCWNICKKWVKRTTTERPLKMQREKKRDKCIAQSSGRLLWNEVRMGTGFRKEAYKGEQDG